MYFITVIALTLVLPLAGAAWEAQHADANFLLLFGKWTAFFAAGARLFIAGLRQALQPRYTLKEIFEIDDDAPLQIVQELGFANLAMGTMGLLSLLHPLLTFAAALMGGLYYGLAGLKHVARKTRSAERSLAMATDLWVFAVLAVYVLMSMGSVAALV